MRGGLLLLALPLLLPGCLGDFSGMDGSDLDCSPVQAQAVGAEADVLVHDTVAQAPGPYENPSITINVRPGQSLVAQATWRANGPVGVVYDGPTGQVTTSVPNSWQSVTSNAPGGEVTLGLQGEPIAYGVAYTLHLVATGCTPV